MIVRLSRRYTFAASHRLHAPGLSDAENKAIYGKCNNPFGHGHNYEVEITVRGRVDSVTGRVMDLAVLDNLAAEQILKPMGHRDLNREILCFQTCVPTTENLAAEIDRRLRAAWPAVFGPDGPVLEKIRILETERNICEIMGAA